MYIFTNISPEEETTVIALLTHNLSGHLINHLTVIIKDLEEIFQYTIYKDYMQFTLFYEVKYSLKLFLILKMFELPFYI